MRPFPRLLLLTLSFVAACASAASRQATSLLDRGDYAGAAALADRELAANPNDDDLLTIRIRAELAAGDSVRALAHYRQWAAAHPDDLALLRQLALDTLGQGVGSPSNEIQRQAIEAAEELELEPLAEAVARQMGDDDDAVVAAAAVAVLRGVPQAPEVAAEMLHSEDPVARAIAVAGVARKVGRFALDDLLAATADPDPRVRRAAVTGIALFGDAKVTQRLIELVDSDRAGAVRAAAYGALSKRTSIDRAAIGQRGVADSYLGARLAAASLLAATKATEPLRALAQGVDLDVAIRAARALRTTHPAEAAAALERALTSDRAATQIAALGSLAAVLGKQGAVQRARRLLEVADPATRLAAARVLADGGAIADATAVLAAVLAGQDPWIQLDAATDLARVGDHRGQRALERLVGEGEPALRRAAVVAHLSTRTLPLGLIAALADPAPAIRVEAARVIIRVARSRDDHR